MKEDAKAPLKDGNACSLDSVMATLRAIGKGKKIEEREPLPSVVRWSKRSRKKQKTPPIAEPIADATSPSPSILEKGNPYLIVLRIMGVYYGIELCVLCGRSREQPAARVRQIYMHLMERVLGVPQAEIGRIFEYDHTSVMYGCDKIAALRVADGEFNAKLRELEDRIIHLKESSAPFVKIPNSPITQAMNAFVTEQRAAISASTIASAEVTAPAMSPATETPAIPSVCVMEAPAKAPIPAATETVAPAPADDAVKPQVPRVTPPPWAQLAANGWDKPKGGKQGNNG